MTVRIVFSSTCFPCQTMGITNIKVSLYQAVQMTMTVMSQRSVISTLTNVKLKGVIPTRLLEYLFRQALALMKMPQLYASLDTWWNQLAQMSYQSHARVKLEYIIMVLRY